ncbi:DUF2178 domain-containing protein [Candidatus Micrarchaeota archaeon]|nr:DUF2178 domain-containing protein [Candidatus Micrarchaeota archaeon]
MKAKNNNDLIRLIAIILISISVIATGALLSINAYAKGDMGGAIGGGIIAAIILVFAIFTFIRGNRDLKKGFPLQDERSKRVMEKAATKAFYASLYLLLILGFLSDELIQFRDVSQATSVAVGGMAILWVVFWVYYNRKEI